jgi:uncharacterized membrane protein YfcA
MLNIFLFISALLAYFVKGITGFGNTLVMGTLFSFVVANRVTTPVDLLFSMPTNVFIVWRERRNISWKMVVPLSLMMMLGTIPGAMFLKTGSDWVLKALLGLVVVGIAMEMLLRNKVANKFDKKSVNPFFLVLIGVISGVLAGLFGIGALLVSYVSRTTDNRSEFRANICCVFLVDCTFRFILYAFAGLLTKELMMLTLSLSPAVVIGMLVATKIDSKLKESTVRKATIGLLLVSGIVLFIKSIFQR